MVRNMDLMKFYILACVLLWKTYILQGIWHQCSRRGSVYTSNRKLTLNESISLCESLDKSSYLAGVDDAEYIQESCIDILDNNTYWINYLSSNNVCVLLQKYYIANKLNVKITRSTCPSVALPVCLSNKNVSLLAKSVTTSVSPTTTTTTTTTTSAIATTTTSDQLLFIPNVSSVSTKNVLSTTSKPLSYSAKSSMTSTTSPRFSSTTTTGVVKVTPDSDGYVINYEKCTHTDAIVMCKQKYNATLITLSSVDKYFETIQPLDLIDDMFWIHDREGLDSESDCLIYDRKNITISESLCDDKHFSICKRISNIKQDDVLKTRDFVNLIKDMTVNKSETFKTSMKLKCIYDQRISSKIVGFCGIAVIVIVGIIFLMFDIINVCQYFKTEDVSR